jgi:excisionase family DNA binding protein
VHFTEHRTSSVVPEPYVAGQPNRKIHMPKLLSLSEVCKQTSISRSTLYRLIQNRRINVVKIGRAVRIPETEIDAFINDLMEASQ